MSFSWIVALLVVIAPLPLHASETDRGTLPPELIKLRDEGLLTVRALWAWGVGTGIHRSLGDGIQGAGTRPDFG